jgi:hypothetical protein
MKNHKTFHLFQEKIVEAHHKKSIEKYFKLTKKCLTWLNLIKDRLNFPKEAVISTINLIIQTIIFKLLWKMKIKNTKLINFKMKKEVRILKIDQWDVLKV